MAPKIHNKKPPKFFQPYLQKHSLAGLRIPDAFIEHLNGSPKKAELRIRSRMENVWYVKMEYVDNRVFFSDGWKKFVKDNSIEDRDMLVFRYDGDHRFDIMIFGISGLEKKGSAEPNVGIDYIDIIEMEEEKEEELEEEHEEAENIVIDVDACHEEEEEDEASDSAIIAVDAIRDSGNNIVDDEDCNEEEEKDDTEEKEQSQATTIRNRKRRGSKIGGNKGGSIKKRASIVGTGVHQGANDLLRSELNKYVQPGNPYFVTKLRKDRSDVLLVPEFMLKDFGVKLTKNITFRNEFGMEWSGKVVDWKDGRKWIKGWRAVCRCNNFCEDECCICVFPLKGDVEKDTIEVHIVVVLQGASDKSFCVELNLKLLYMFTLIYDL